MNTEQIAENVPSIPVHTHDFVTPVFTERKSDAHLIISGLMCECHEELDLDF